MARDDYFVIAAKILDYVDAYKKWENFVVR